MDINLVIRHKGTNIQPVTIHGMLWLQTHFCYESWDALAESNAVIPTEDARNLSEDARKAGLNINYLPAFIESKKL
tara:strand:- start:10 stop:237 length:228 start_codon:yes stop_codon:yes gene_type:complete